MSATFKIEKGIPIPPDPRGRTEGSKYPFLQMEVGDSVYLPGKKSVGSILKYARSKKPELRFTTRTDGQGIRVWRIK
jgi:hypothetical protein